MSATRERGARLAGAWTRVTREVGGRGLRDRLPSRPGVARTGPAAARIGAAGARTGPAAARMGHGLRRGVAASRQSGRRHPRGALAAALAGLILILGCGWLWFRDSSFVSVSRVSITGLSGPSVGQIEGSLRNAALTMSTLDVNINQLRTVVNPYPDVRSLTVQTQFPHGLVIHVREEVPVARLSAGGRTLAVSQDGTLLPYRGADARLPYLLAGAITSGSRVTGAGPRAALAVLAAAPYRFLAHIQNATESAQNGVVVQVRRGPQLRFGSPTELRDKWAAAIAVLGSASSQGAQYIDVTDPRRPAAGVPTASPAGSSGAGSSAGASGTSSSTGTAGTTGTTGTTGATSTANSTSGTAATTTAGSTGTAGTAASTGTPGSTTTSTTQNLPPAAG